VSSEDRRGSKDRKDAEIEFDSGYIQRSRLGLSIDSNWVTASGEGRRRRSVFDNHEDLTMIQVLIWA